MLAVPMPPLLPRPTLPLAAPRTLSLAVPMSLLPCMSGPLLPMILANPTQGTAAGHVSTCANIVARVKTPSSSLSTRAMVPSPTVPMVGLRQDAVVGAPDAASHCPGRCRHGRPC
jgi:hypothetical protein